jgi:hypothetical protein
MSAEDNKAIARRYWEEVWSTGNVAMVDEIVAPDSLFHSGASINTRDNEARKQGTTRWRTWVLDLRTTSTVFLRNACKSFHISMLG